MTSVSEHLKVYIVYVPTKDGIQLWLQQLCEKVCRASGRTPPPVRTPQHLLYSPLLERFYHGETGMKTAEGSEKDVEQENQQGGVGEGELSVYLRLEAGD